ncbi:MAG: alkaline phosphatase [Acidobacteriota bacterium]
MIGETLANRYELLAELGGASDLMRRGRRCVILFLLVLQGSWASAASGARNVILMIADGAGFNTWAATAMYQGTYGRDFQDQPGWVCLAASTHPLRRTAAIPVARRLGLIQLPALVYDPVKAWDPRPVPEGAGKYPYYFAGYKWLRETASDSANTATALVTGQRTYRGSINVDGRGAPIEETLAWLARKTGRKVGTLSTVPFSHATPAAAGGAHAKDRRNYCSLAVEMLTQPGLDFIGGCGHPDFDQNGREIREPSAREYRYVGGREVWERLTGAAPLQAGDAVCTRFEGQSRILGPEEARALGQWTLEQTREQIEALQEGPVPARLLIVPQVGERGFGDESGGGPTGPGHVRIGGTLQQQRGSRADPRFTAPGDDPLLTTVPSLETLTRVALNALDDAPSGFFLHVEGGAVDWAMHANQMGRMIEEMIDFKRAVGAVTAWVKTHGGWDRTLLIVTADHDHLLWGPRSNRVPFDPLEDHGAGRLPSYRWLSNRHANSLVPVFARGADADLLLKHARQADPFYGPYVDQTELFEAMKAALQPGT